MINVYKQFAEQWMCLPVIVGHKSPNERFAGAEDTLTIEALMQDGKALQSGTSHFLGQNFAKAFDVKYATREGKLEYVWATSWGVSTRLMGALIMAHSDNNGLVLPPKLAPIQVVIVPIYKGEEQLAAARAKMNEIADGLAALGIRVQVDDRDNLRPGFKFAEYELKGVPVRLALGQRDLQNGTIELARRDTLTKETVPQVFSNNAYYDQLSAIAHIGSFVEEVKAAGIAVSERTLAGLNFNFFGIDLAQVPNINIFSETFAWDWNHLGGILIPVLSAGSQVLSMWVSQKTNNSVITDKNGVHDEETAKNSQAAQQSQMMMWMMPLMSLWFGLTVPVALSLYWMIGGLIENVVMTNHYRKVYDAEDAIRLERMMEREREEAERERVRAERRAANPDGQTQNTSKKKLQQKQRAEEEAAKAAALKEYNAKRGIFEEEEEGEKPMSGIAERPWCKGRAYDPDRYSNNTEE